MGTRTYRIPDMHCANCEMALESIEDELPGIRAITASYRRQLLVVEFDETRISPDRIVSAVQKKGYHPEEV